MSTYLHPQDRELFSSLDPAKLDQIREARRLPLAKRKESILGVRAESLSFLIDAFKRGVYRVASPGDSGKIFNARSKEASVPTLFLDPNPECVDRRLGPLNIDFLGLRERGLHRVIQLNLDIYGDVATAHPFSEHVFPVVGIEAVWNIFNELNIEANNWGPYPKYERSLVGEHDVLREYFFEDLHGILLAVGKNKPDFMSNQISWRQAQDFIDRLKSLIPGDLWPFVGDLHERTAVSVGFDRALLDRYEVLKYGDPRRGKESLKSELVFHVPEGGVPVEYLFFEAIGDAEEECLDALLEE